MAPASTMEPDGVSNKNKPGENTQTSIIDAVQSASIEQSPTATTPDSTSEWTVEKVLSSIPNPTTHYPSPSSTVPAPTTPIPFLHLLERLKTTKREGWRRFGISSGESIADHMYRMSIITLLCPPALLSRLNVDIPRATKMALVHDMAESLVGDITPVDGVSKPEKSRRERETMRFLSQGLLGGYAGGVQGDELRGLWEEYEAGETAEAVFVHDVDKLELVLQMVEYERRGEGRLNLEEFAWVAGRIQCEEMREWCRIILEEREAMWVSFPAETGEQNGKSQENGIPDGVLSGGS